MSKNEKNGVNGLRRITGLKKKSGWIDGQIRSLNEEKYIQRCTPRKPKSSWSVINIERSKRMISEGKMSGWGLEKYSEGMKTNKIVPSSKSFSLSSDLKKALTKNRSAWSNFNKFSPSAQLMYVHWVDTAKTTEPRQKRIMKTVELSAKNKKFGEKEKG